MRSIITAASLSVVSASLLRVNFDHSQKHALAGRHTLMYGDGNCECIGIDNIQGATETIAGLYPADLGARCQAWDKDHNAKCTGSKPEKWCADKWCYVDPCKCDIAVLPKVSAYLPNAQYQGKPVYYSYATCGSVDNWAASEKHEEENNDVAALCSKPLVDERWGKSQCRCVGIDGQKGNTKMLIRKEPQEFMDYPADTGATCDMWDMGRNPACKGASKPDWCSNRWCFVDPCSCDLPDTPPKPSQYLPGALIQGKSVHYSYATCNAQDLYMDKKDHKNALKEQLETCSSAWAATSIAGLLFASISYIFVNK